MSKQEELKGRISRRSFLKAAGVSAGVGLPLLVGYGLVRSARGVHAMPASPLSVPGGRIHRGSNQVNGVPLLVLTNSRSNNPYGAFLSEILLAEGVNSFVSMELDESLPEDLGAFDIILLAEGSPTALQREMLEGYVHDGGCLVAMRPDLSLASVLGVAQVQGSLSNGYVRLNETLAETGAMVPDAIQFHGDADLYRPAGADAWASLMSSEEDNEGYIGVSVHRFGQGWAAMWAFDLAKSVALMRQGNPALARNDVQAWDGRRAVNMFVGWIDLEKIAIPQADEQQRLLIHMLHWLSQSTRPLPRLWYFPAGVEAMLIATGDSHMNPGGAIEEMLALVESYGGRMSVYYSPDVEALLQRAAKKAALQAKRLPIVGPLVSRWVVSPAPADVADWRARGHEFALHPWVEEGLDAGWEKYWEEFTGMGYGPVPATVRTHRVLWDGWVETAEFQAARGMRMNLDYYHWGPLLRKADGEWAFGYFTGSGRPMRFIDLQGRILGVYQQITQLADDHILQLHWPGVANFPPAEAVGIAIQMLESSVMRYHGAIVANFHIDPIAVGGEARENQRQFVAGVLGHAQTLGIPVWTSQAWLEFVDRRSESLIDEVAWDGGARRLSFRLRSNTHSGAAIEVMLPEEHGGYRLRQVRVQGVPISHDSRQLAGVRYGVFAAEPGERAYSADYA